MKRSEQHRRDLAIAVEIASTNRTQAEDANAYGVSPKTVQRACKRARRLSSDFDAKPALGIYEVDLLRLDAAIEDLGIARAEAQNPRTAIAAIRLQADVILKKTEREMAVWQIIS